jgi:PilZ domain
MPVPSLAEPSPKRERRAHPRHAVNHRGLLAFEDGSEQVACRLINLSEGGALVHVNEAQKLPRLVSLFYDRLDEHLPEVTAAWCMVIRREPNRAALRFLHVVG